VLFIVLSAFIIFESAMPGGESSSQSGLFAFIFDNGAKEAQIIKPESISIEGDKEIFLTETKEYSASLYPENSSYKSFRWKGSDDSVCSFDSSTGSLKAISVGTYVLTATSTYDSNIKSSIEIKVSKYPITYLSIESESKHYSLVNGMTDRIVYSTDKKDLEYSDITFISSNQAIASIDRNGFLYSHSIGEVEISASIVWNGLLINSNSIEISVTDGLFNPTTNLEYCGNSYSYVGQSISYSIKFNSEATDKKFFYNVSDNSIVVTNNLITGTKSGMYSIYFYSLSNKQLVYVVNIDIKTVDAKSVTIESLSIQYGKQTQLEYALVSMIDGLDVTDKEMVFQSSDETVATIDENGYVLGYKKGQTKITAKWKQNEEIQASRNIIITSMASDSFNNLNYIIRKTVGHFSLFLLTGCFGYLAISESFIKRKKLWLPVLINCIYGFLLGIGSELLQMTTNGRTPSYIDVLIDFGGYLTGAFIVMGILILIKKKRSKSDVLTS
jgi:uncharacterized protein YjdB